MFDRLDADHDGSITREEMAQAHARRGGAARRPAREAPAAAAAPACVIGGPAAPGGPACAACAACAAQRMFGEQGFVTREQFRERALARFDRADANHDGTLTAAERQALRGQRRRAAAGAARPAELNA